MRFSGRSLRWLLTVLLILSTASLVGAQGTKTAELIQKAKRGDPKAQYQLGVMYDNGLGVPKDSSEAIRWWRRAAEQGNKDAQAHIVAEQSEPAQPELSKKYVSPSAQTAHLDGSVHATVQHPSHFTPETLAQIRTISKADRYNRYEILAIPEVNESAARLFGTRMQEYLSYKVLLRGEIVDGYLIVETCMQHGCGNFGAILIINLTTGKAAGALHDEFKVSPYPGDYKTIAEAPAMLRTWTKESKQLVNQFAAGRAATQRNPKEAAAQSNAGVTTKVEERAPTSKGHHDLGNIIKTTSQDTNQPPAELIKQAEKGYPWAQFNLGDAYANGQGVAIDLVKAERWYARPLSRETRLLSSASGGCMRMARGSRKMKSRPCAGTARLPSKDWHRLSAT